MQYCHPNTTHGHKLQQNFYFKIVCDSTNPYGRQCEGMSHQQGGSVPLTSTEAPLPPPAHRRVESADLQICLFSNFGKKILCVLSANKAMHSIPVYI